MTTNAIRRETYVLAASERTTMMAMAMREGTDERLCIDFGMTEVGIPYLRTRAESHFARIESLIDAAGRIGRGEGRAVSPPQTTEGDLPKTLAFDLEDGRSLTIEEITTIQAGEGDLVHIIRTEDARGTTRIRMSSVPRNRMVVRKKRIHLGDLRRTIGAIATVGRTAVDGLTGRNGYEPDPNLPESMMEAARGCVRLIGERNRLPKDPERRGSHTFATPWCRGQTIVDDVLGTTTPAEEQWLPKVMRAELRTPSCMNGPCSLELNPFWKPTEFGGTDVLAHMRSLAALTAFTPEEPE